MTDKFSLGVKHSMFNNEVRKRRQELGLSQDQLGKVIGIGKQRIGQIETLRAYPTQEVAQKIADFFEVKPQELFPQWIEMFKDKKTTVVSVHEVDQLSFAEVPEQFLITDGNENDEDKIDNDILCGTLKKSMESLSHREKQVIQLRFGMDTDISDDEIKRLDGKTSSSYGAKSLDEVGQVFGVSRERVRQVEAKALRKIRRAMSRHRDVLGFKKKK